MKHYQVLPFGYTLVTILIYLSGCECLDSVCSALTCSFNASQQNPMCLWKSQWASAPNWIHAADSPQYDEQLQSKDRNHLLVVGDDQYVQTRIVLQSAEFVNTEDALFSFKYFMGRMGMSLRLCLDDILCECPSEKCLWQMKWDETNPRFPITGPLNQWKPCKRLNRAFWDCDEGLKEVVDIPRGKHRFYFVAFGAKRQSLLGVDSFDVVLEDGLICTPDYDKKVDINGRFVRVNEETKDETTKPVQLTTTTESTTTTTTSTTTTTTKPPTTSTTTTTTTTPTTTTSTLPPTTTTTPNWDEFFGLTFTTTNQPSDNSRELFNLLSQITPGTIRPRLDLPTAKPRSPYLRSTDPPAAKASNFNFGLDLKKILGAPDTFQPQSRQTDFYPTISPLKDRTINWLSAIDPPATKKTVDRVASTPTPQNPDQKLAAAKRRTIAPPVTLPPPALRTTKPIRTTPKPTTTALPTTTPAPTTTEAPVCFEGPVKVAFSKKILETLTEYENWDGTLWECQTECLGRRDCLSVSYCVHTNPATCKLHGASCTELQGVCDPYAPAHMLGFYYEKRPYDFEACRLSEVNDLFRR